MRRSPCLKRPKIAVAIVWSQFDAPALRRLVCTGLSPFDGYFANAAEATALDGQVRIIASLERVGWARV